MLNLTNQCLSSRAFVASPKLRVVSGLHKTWVLQQGVPSCCTRASSTSQPAASTLSAMAALPKIHLNVENFRDLAEANGTIKPGRVWRCARPSTASDADVSVLLDQLGIRDLIDLRSSEGLDRYYPPIESYNQSTPKRATHTNTLAKEAPTVSSLSISSDASSASPPMGSTSAALNGQSGQKGGNATEPAKNSEGPPGDSTTQSSGSMDEKKGAETGGGSWRPRTLFQGTQFRRYLRQWLSWQAYVESKGADTPVIHHQVSLLERRRFYGALLTRVPAQMVATAMALGLLQFKEQSRLILLREVNAGGLALLYKIILDSAKIEIRTVLDLICNSLENRRPVLFFCNAGKDRTGIIAALVLACSGATDLQIVDDYARSDAYHAMALAGIENKPELAGLDRAVFERAPAGAMRETIAYINQKYGSLAAYMTHIGFGPERQKRLRYLLIKDA